MLSSSCNIEDYWFYSSCTLLNNHGIILQHTIMPRSDTIKGNESALFIFLVFNILHVDSNPTSIGHLVGEIWIFFLKFKNIRTCHLYKLVTQNQFSRHLTLSSWSCRSYRTDLFKVQFENKVSCYTMSLTELDYANWNVI